MSECCLIDSTELKKALLTSAVRKNNVADREKYDACA